MLYMSGLSYPATPADSDTVTLPSASVGTQSPQEPPPGDAQAALVPQNAEDYDYMSPDAARTLARILQESVYSPTRADEFVTESERQDRWPDTPVGGPAGYTGGLTWDAVVDWPASRATPSLSVERYGSYGLTPEERIRGVTQQMMAHLPQSFGYTRGPDNWPPSPPTPLTRDTITVDPERRTVVVRHGAPGAGLDWPGSSTATPVPATREPLIRARPRPDSSVSTPPAEQSSSETLVQGQDSSPRRDVNLPWNVQPASNYTAPTGDSTTLPIYEPPPDAADYDGPEPYTAVSLQRIFDDGFLHEAPSIYYTPPQECSSKEDNYTPFQSANEMLGDSSASEHEPESDRRQDRSGYPERERFATRSARLMSRYEGVQPCLPYEALQPASDAGSEPFSSPRDAGPDRGADPGYDPPQMWYGHDRASLPSDAGSELAPGTSATSGYAQSQGESEFPTSASDTSDMVSLTPPASEEANCDGPSPDTMRTLASIFQAGPGRAAVGGGGPPFDDQVGAVPEWYEPAQGEYGYQRYPQGYEPPQMWYGHDRALLPPQKPAGTPPSSEAVPDSSDQPAEAGGETEDFDFVSPDTTETMARIFKDGTPRSVEVEGTSAPKPSGVEEKEDFDGPSPDTTKTLTKIFKDGTPDPVQTEGSGTGPGGGTDAGSSGSGEDEGEPYEPAQGEYGFQRYPQGYEPPQMWYGHDRASLPGQKPAEQASADEPTLVTGAVEGKEGHDGIQPDTTKTLANIFEDGMRRGGAAATMTDASLATAADGTTDAASTSDADDRTPAATCQDDHSWSETSLGSAETPPASRSVEYVPAAGMYGFQPPLGPPSRGSVEQLPPSDDTYTQGLCVWQCPDSWPPTPSTPGSTEDMSGAAAEYAAPALNAQYVQGLRWDGPKDWRQMSQTPPTPGSQERLLRTSVQRTADDNCDLVSPDTTRTMAVQFEHGIPCMADQKPPRGAEGEDYEPAQGEYGFQRYPQGYEPPQMWYGHDRASVSSPRSSQDLSSQAVSSGDPSPAITPRPSRGYEPAQGIYGFQRVFAGTGGTAAAAPAAAADSAVNFDGPCPDTSRSLERIFEAGTATMGEQRPLTPSPNLPAFLEKLASSSESEDSAGRRRTRPSESAPAVRVPRNRFYSMEKISATAPSQPNMTPLSSSPHGRVTPRSDDQQCYLPWTHRASVPYQEPEAAQFVEDYQEPPLVEMDDQMSVPTPTSSQSRRSDSEKAGPEKTPPSEGVQSSRKDTPSSVGHEPPTDAAGHDRHDSYKVANPQRIFESGTGRKQPESSLACESKSVESAHNDIEDMLQRLRSLESRLHSVEDESQSKDRQIQQLLSRLEGLVSSAGADAQGDLGQRLQSASETVTSLELTESRLSKELDNTKKEIDNYITQLESRSEEMELRLSESQRLQAAGDQQLQQLAQQCGQLAAERDQLVRQLEESRARVAEKETRVEQLVEQLQQYSERVEQLEREVERGAVPVEASDIAAENAYLRGRIEELERDEDNEENWREQVQEAEEQARAMEKALDQLASEKRTEEERRREVETQLMQMVRRTSVAHVTAPDGSATAAEESSADELLDPQLCRRLQQLLTKLHTKGLKALSMLELRFVKLYASPSQLTPRSLAADSVVEVTDMDNATLRRAVARLVEELKLKQQELNTKVSRLSRGLRDELVQVRQLQTALDTEHKTKLSLTERLSEQRGTAGALEADLAQALSELHGAEERLDQTRSNFDSRRHEFAAAKTTAQQLVDREQKIMQELIRTADAGCQDLERVQACLARLDGAGDRVSQLCAKVGNSGTLQRLSEQLMAEQQRCCDMLACVECERGRAAQLCQELDQGRAQARTDGCRSEQLQQRVTELEQRSSKLEKQVDAACAEVRRTGPDDSKPLEQLLKREQQDVRQVQAAHRSATEDLQRPAGDLSQATATLCRSAAELLTTVTTVVDTNVEAGRVRTRLLRLGIELCGRDDSDWPTAPAPAPVAAAGPDPAVAATVDDTVLVRYKQQLESERAKWGQERRLLQAHIEQLDAELERVRVATQPAPVTSQGEGDDGRVQEAHSRYMRAESYRRALCWQKRYLMILLGGYQETETMTLEKMVQLTGGCFLPDYRRLLQPVRKFRAAAWTVIAMLRMQYMVNRWNSGRLVAGTRRRGRRQRGPRSFSRGGGSKSRSTSRHKPPAPRPAAAPRPRAKPKPTVRIPSPNKNKTISRPFKRARKKTPSPGREEEPTPTAGGCCVANDDLHVEFDTHEEVTPRAENSSLGELLNRLDEGIDEVVLLGEEEEEDEVTPRSISRGSTVVVDEDVCEQVSLTPTLPLSTTSLISSGESEVTRFFTDFANQQLPDMEMECGITESMPNLAGFDVRSVTTVSDVESDELEHYLALFDSLFDRQDYSPRPTSATSQSSRHHL